VTIGALGNRTSQLYDAVRNLTFLEDAWGNVTTFAYASLNRKIAETEAIGSTSFAYNAVGDEISKTDALGQQTTFSYGGADRETGTTWRNCGGSVTQVAIFTYDNAGNMLTAANAEGTYTMSSNALNQLVGVDELFGQDPDTEKVETKLKQFRGLDCWRPFFDWGICHDDALTIDHYKGMCS
jgi:YD repeat-containing protein